MMEMTNSVDKIRWVDRGTRCLNRAPFVDRRIWVWWIADIGQVDLRGGRYCEVCGDNLKLMTPPPPLDKTDS